MYKNNTKLRKIALFFGGLILFIVILNLLFSIFRFPFVKVSPFEAIPSESAFVLEYHANYSIRNSLVAENLELELLDRFEEDRLFFKKLFPDTFLSVKAKKSIAVLQRVSAFQMDFLHILDVKNTQSDSLILKQSLQGIYEEEYSFQGFRYYRFQTPDGKTFNTFKYRNLRLFARYAVQIEDAIRQLKNFRNNLNHHHDFKKLIVRSHDAPCNLYVNPEAFSTFFNAFLRDEYRPLLKVVARFSSWMRFDISQTKPIGVFYPRTPNHTKKQNKDREIINVLPDHSGFVAIHDNSGLVTPNDSIYNRYFAPFTSGQWALGLVNAHTSADRLLILKARDKEHLQHYLEKYEEEKGLLLNTSYQTYPINRFLDNQALAPFIDHLGLDLENPYYTLIDRYIIFSKSSQCIETLIDKYIAGQTLANDTDFLNWYNKISRESDAMIYWKGADLNSIIQKMLAKNFKESSLRNKHKFIKRIGGFNLFKKTKHTEIAFNFLETVSRQSHTDILWKVNLSDKVIGKPKALWNKSKEAYEILVRDASHNLYMLNNRGGLLWKRAFDGPILSDIFEMDDYYGKEMHLLFNTAEKIFLLNQNGEDTGNYPLRLQSLATNGLALFDFKKDKRYQFFLSCANGYAYGFDKDGNPVLGWNPKTEAGNIDQAFQHFQIENKDYILGLDRNGQLSAYDRRGQLVFSNTATKKTQQTNFSIADIADKKTIILSEPSGQIQLINDQGKEIQLALKIQPDILKIVTDNNLKRELHSDFVVLKDNKIIGFQYRDLQVEQMFEIQLKEKPDDFFIIYPTEPDQGTFFGIFNKDAGTINLIDIRGNQPDDFPLAGTGLFTLVDLFGENQKIILVANEKAVYAYQLGEMGEN